MQSVIQKKPFTLIKTAMSLDGFIDDLSPSRLLLSNEKDLDAVDKLKSTFDAILVGAETIRKDNPSLLIKSEIYQKERIEKGLRKHPIKVTICMSGQLNSNCRFFKDGDVEKFVYCPENIRDSLQQKLGNLATVIGLLTKENQIHPADVLEDLFRKGINRLMIEGGGNINTLFLKENLVDAMRIAVAPFFVGQQQASRLVMSADLPQNKQNQMTLERTEILGDMVVMYYSIKKDMN